MGSIGSGSHSDSVVSFDSFFLPSINKCHTPDTVKILNAIIVQWILVHVTRIVFARETQHIHILKPFNLKILAVCMKSFPHPVWCRISNVYMPNGMCINTANLYLISGLPYAFSPSLHSIWYMKEMCMFNKLRTVYASVCMGIWCFCNHSEFIRAVNVKFIYLFFETWWKHDFYRFACHRDKWRYFRFVFFQLCYVWVCHTPPDIRIKQKRRKEPLLLYIFIIHTNMSNQFFMYTPHNTKLSIQHWHMTTTPPAIAARCCCALSPAQLICHHWTILIISNFVFKFRFYFGESFVVRICLFVCRLAFWTNRRKKMEWAAMAFCNIYERQAGQPINRTYIITNITNNNYINDNQNHEWTSKSKKYKPANRTKQKQLANKKKKKMAQERHVPRRIVVAKLYSDILSRKMRNLSWDWQRGKKSFVIAILFRRAISLWGGGVAGREVEKCFWTLKSIRKI